MASDEIRDILLETDLFGNRPDQIISDAVSSTERVTFKPNELIYENGDTCRESYVVADGSIRVGRPVDEDKETSFIARRSEVFGLLTALTGEERRTKASAVSDQEAHCLQIEMDEFLDRLEERGALLRSFYDDVLNRMSSRLLRSSRIIDTFL